jgi:nitrous oxide reductase
MTQADRVHSTPPTNTPADTTRRHFLSQSAGVAAGGAVLALAAVSASADAAAPMAAMAPSEVDPIFKLIGEYRAAAKAIHPKARLVGAV